ncbi:MAG: hypothetical protein H7328_09180 [Bdellovibrio sp.]|nr:hypothetical protein [Bdellovibrio sp.]
MSITKLLKPLVVITAGAFVGFYAVQFFVNQPTSQSRFLASATMSKLGSEQFSKSFFDIKIKNEDLAEKNDAVSTVKVNLEAFQKLPAGLTFTWHLPKDAEIVDGSLTGIITELEASQTQEFEIKIKGYSHELKNHVVFAIKGSVQNSLIDRNVIVSSRPEDSFEYIVQAYEKSKTLEAKAKKKLGQTTTHRGPIDPKDVIF